MGDDEEVVDAGTAREQCSSLQGLKRKRAGERRAQDAPPRAGSSMAGIFLSRHDAAPDSRNAKLPGRTAKYASNFLMGQPGSDVARTERRGTPDAVRSTGQPNRLTQAARLPEGAEVNVQL